MAGLLRSNPPELADCSLTLVPAVWGVDVLAHFGWYTDSPRTLFAALLRSWHERFGAEVVAAFGGEVHVAVPRPPLGPEHIDQLALEHVLTGADNLSEYTFPDIAAGLVRRIRWSFWWD